MRVVLLLLLALSAPGLRAQEPENPAFAAILSRRGLDVEALRSLGYVLEGPAARRLGPDGGPAGAPLTPEELEQRLAALERGEPFPAKPSPVKRIPPVAPSIDVGPSALGLLYDGRAGGSDVLAVSPGAAPPAPWTEPPFDASWSAVEAGFKNKKTRPAAVKALAQRFRKSTTTVTGLSDDAPEALRLLTREIHEGRGGDAAAVELKRELATAAMLKDQQKFEFTAKITSPVTVYVALARSRASHSLDSRLYFNQMVKTLEKNGSSLSAFMAEQDPLNEHGVDFLLRAHSYDALIPFLEKRPQEAGALGPLLFPEGKESEIAARADALEGLILQLAVKGRAGGAAALFVKALVSHAQLAKPETARRVAVYLKLNEPVLPKFLRADVAKLEPLLPPGVLEDAGLVPPDPRQDWPAGRWTFVNHFASTASYAGYLSRFLARGWVSTMTATNDLLLTRDFNGTRVDMITKLYQGDEEDFLRGAEAQRFLASVKKDLRDPNVQGVILRTHAQFRVPNLFDSKTNPNKLLLDGACRSAWDLKALRQKCPSCLFILNTGTGRGKLNNDAVIAVVEGLAKDLEWSEIGAEFARNAPSTSARIQGPWTPPFAEALRVLSEREKADLKAAGS